MSSSLIRAAVLWSRQPSHRSGRGCGASKRGWQSTVFGPRGDPCWNHGSPFPFSTTISPFVCRSERLLRSYEGLCLASALHTSGAPWLGPPGTPCLSDLFQICAAYSKLVGPWHFAVWRLWWQEELRGCVYTYSLCELPQDAPGLCVQHIWWRDGEGSHLAYTQAHTCASKAYHKFQLYPF